MALKLNPSKTIVGTPVPVAPRVARVQATRLNVRAEAQPEEFNRRQALGLVAGVSGLISAAPSFAAYGEAANVFGKATNTSGFIPFSGDGYALLIPARWNPSKEREFPGTVFRYEDNFDAVTFALVTVTPTEKKAITDFGSTSDFLNATVGNYLGQQSYDGSTMSEGGFAPNKVSNASLLGVEETTDKSGKKYYRYELLTRTADGDEGGRHQLFSATVSGGNLYIMKVQCGDKRWFKGANKDCYGMRDSFTVA